MIQMMHFLSTILVENRAGMKLGMYSVGRKVKETLDCRIILQSFTTHPQPTK